MRKVVRYYVQFVCSNGRTRFAGPDWHMPYNRQAAELYTTAAECFDRMDAIPPKMILRGTQPEIRSRAILVPDLPSMGVTLPGLRPHHA